MDIALSMHLAFYIPKTVSEVFWSTLCIYHFPVFTSKLFHLPVLCLNCYLILQATEKLYLGKRLFILVEFQIWSTNKQIKNSFETGKFSREPPDKSRMIILWNWSFEVTPAIFFLPSGYQAADFYCEHTLLVFKATTELGMEAGCE